MANTSIPSVLPDGTFAQTTTEAKKEDSADRFLKLLVAQMQNQDPMNPMDNAEVTSQMAQISTVSGIEKLNTSFGGFSSSFAQMQALQSVALVGHDVVLPGNKLLVETRVGADDSVQRIGIGGFEMQSPADKVKVEMMDASGKVVGTLDLGNLTSGTQTFTWDPGSVNTESGVRFRVIATRGKVSTEETPLMRDRVNAVNVSGNSLTLELQSSGSVPYSSIKAFN